ncbi:sensor histidine kinase [Roseateles sp. BYS180W]|uniref:Sensor histidine kinase n=1 Tax=Roseateles rivi TaxID=3299028 RepID=A0ABW7FUN8_9BURK
MTTPWDRRAPTLWFVLLLLAAYLSWHSAAAAATAEANWLQAPPGAGSASARLTLFSQALLLGLGIALVVLNRGRNATGQTPWLVISLCGWVMLPYLYHLPWFLPALNTFGTTAVGYACLRYILIEARIQASTTLWLLTAQVLIACLQVTVWPDSAPTWVWIVGIELLLAQTWLVVQRWRALQLLERDWPLPRIEAALQVLTLLLGLLGLCIHPWQPSLAVVLASLAILTQCSLQIYRIGQSLQVAEYQRVQAELRLQERIAEVEQYYSQQAETRLEQVTERERKRIAADLHDDLGAKLLTIVHTSDSERISTLAREALEEMRLSVRGLTGRPVQLMDAIGDWRAEVVSRLAQANINAEWKSPAEEVQHTYPARAYVQTTRIIREAVSNIIKHSAATNCVVTCGVQAGYFSVVIKDNGQGIAMDVEGRLDRGHGMASMKARAKQLLGQCLVESAVGRGTVIRLTVPL